MRPTGSEYDVAFAGQPLKAGIAIDMQACRTPLKSSRCDAGARLFDPVRTDRPPTAVPVHSTVVVRGRRPTAAPFSFVRGPDRAPGPACRRRTNAWRRIRSRTIARAMSPATRMRRQPIRPASSQFDKASMLLNRARFAFVPRGSGLWRYSGALSQLTSPRLR
jgi:hypothetical protein